MEPHTDAKTQPAENEDLIAPSSTEHPLFDEIVEAIRTVYDPEIPVNLYDLGLIYRIQISEESAVEIDMTLTAPPAGSRVMPTRRTPVSTARVPAGSARPVKGPRRSVR